MRVDLGHHIITGLGDALVRAIAPDRLAFIRIRRNRSNNAKSFLANKAIPCGGNYNAETASLGKGMFILCPWDHGSVILGDDPDALTKWEKLNDFQRCLWYVDEVEARWQLLKRKYPYLQTIETEPWTTSEDLMDIMNQVRDFASVIVVLHCSCCVCASSSDRLLTRSFFVCCMLSCGNSMTF